MQGFCQSLTNGNRRQYFQAFHAPPFSSRTHKNSYQNSFSNSYSEVVYMKTPYLNANISVTNNFSIMIKCKQYITQK